MNKFQIKRFEYVVTILLQRGAAQWVALVGANNEFLLTATVYGLNDFQKKASEYGWEIDEYLRPNPKHPFLVLVDFESNRLLAAYECKKPIDNSLFAKIDEYYETAKKIDISGSRALFPSFQRMAFWVFSAVIIVFFINLFLEKF